jgi:hypothetical protein
MSQRLKPYSDAALDVLDKSRTYLRSNSRRRSSRSNSRRNSRSSSRVTTRSKGRNKKLYSKEKFALHYSP